VTAAACLGDTSRSPPATITRPVISINNFFRISTPFVKKDEEPVLQLSFILVWLWCWNVTMALERLSFAEVPSHGTKKT
jgi:hypothetical protein